MTTEGHDHDAEVSGRRRLESAGAGRAGRRAAPAAAGLLIEGHTDAVIADRLGMNIPTARVRIARLAATLGRQ
ncbi:hypothetical protein SSP24_39220 [Streptomyces spinoverrucosus]|uniref:HTH luxR-type domain-containing protein n=1 Tax=Streptomyces spinoverrucosus TaxID=284043 RepID=A0A4Y3VHA8_9ACTN|nr:hypothetical protein SSP24_39220 [Streptomyces spinoverrucosus]GHB75784.1 hypothetical protein GCM10010397_52790 [Streptomyces spinoverrucosus]